MRLSGGTRLVLLALVCFSPGLLPVNTLRAQEPGFTVVNNHEIPFKGAIEVPLDLPDGSYRGPSAIAQLNNGTARIFAKLGAAARVELTRYGRPDDAALRGSLGITSQTGRLFIQWEGREVGSVDLGLAVTPGKSGTVDSAVAGFAPLPVKWIQNSDGTLSGTAQANGYSIALSASPFGGGMLDFRARLTHSASTAPGYLALVRRIVTPGTTEARLRFNGREMKGGESPDTWDRDFWYTRGVDWLSWKARGLSLLSVNGFSPAPTILRDTTWAEASHFYVWERTRQQGDTSWLVSEIAGPNAEQARSRYMPVTPYAALHENDTVSLKWRLAIEREPAGSWQESQLRAFAGYRTASVEQSNPRIEIGVPSVSFGTSYFPYSTLAENFDYYRTPGLNSEAFWPISPLMWSGWRAFEPRMRSDLHIVRAMGFESVRLHHLELLQTIKREEAFAFLDFFIGEARALGLRIVVDSEGPAEWISSVISRYRDDVSRVELENEVLIGGIKPSDPARWTSLYNAAKNAAPAAQVFFTGAGNNAMFERLRSLKVPFDRVGVHAYKHGPQWKEAYSSHMLGTAGYATEIGKPVTLGEFNWKDLTRMSPEKRVSEVREIYQYVLAPRAIPELFEFQLQESLTFNPSVSGSASRHYEPLSQDRRPKPEGLELMKIIREYGSPSAPMNELPITVKETRFAGDTATASFTMTNATARALRIVVEAMAFDGLGSRLQSPGRVTLRPGATYSGRVRLGLTGEKRIGTYHHFVRAAYENRQSIGWGVASKPGSPQFSPESPLGDRVLYPQSAGVVSRIDWNRPTAVAFGEKASVLELESAYQLATTLQSATGRAVRVSSIADVPDSIIRRGLLLLVGTPSSNTMVPALKLAGTMGSRPGAGIIWLNSANGRESLVLSGPDGKAVQAAVVELVLRYWPSAKDATMRLTGMEPGAALGHRAGGDAVDPP